MIRMQSGSIVIRCPEAHEAHWAEKGWTRIDAAPAPGPDTEPAPQINAMTVPQLRAYATENGIDVTGAKRRNDLIEVITHNEAPESADDSEENPDE